MGAAGRSAIGSTTIALPVAAGVFEPVFGLTLRPGIAALTMAGSGLIVAANVLALKRLRLPNPSPRQQLPAPGPGDLLVAGTTRR